MVLSFADKVSNKARELRGRIKRNTGEVSGDPALRAKGRAEETRGNLDQAGESSLVVAQKEQSRRARKRRLEEALVGKIGACPRDS